MFHAVPRGGSEPSPVVLLAGLLGLAPAPAWAASTATTAPARALSPDQALAVARAAFEYRDFDEVVRALDPWVHPPRIRDAGRMIRARRLLGVSLHVLGDERAAREEFAQLLLLDPDHRLDPFVIPPRVIATFEEVRDALGPRLAEAPPGGDEDPPRARGPPHPLLLWMPLGVPQLALDETETALVLGALQVVGLVANVVAFERGGEVAAPAPGAADPAERDIWLGVQYGGLAVAALAYAGSVVHGHLRRDADRPPPPGPALTLRF